MRRLPEPTFPRALFVALPGRGKGVGFVTPNILAFGCSTVELDVKGENLRETARQREQTEDAAQAAKREHTDLTSKSPE